MTETDATRRPLTMPEHFIPYLEKYRIYKVFKDLIEDLIINLPNDHLKQMKIFLSRHLYSTNDIDKIMLLVSPELKIDTMTLVKALIKDLGFIVITRRCVMDRYEKHDNYIPGCVSIKLMCEVTKYLANKEQVAQTGWLMFDHPCTTAEARYLQQSGVFPTVTLALMPTRPVAPKAETSFTRPRKFFQQDFEGLKFAYSATLKEVYLEPEDSVDRISVKCFNAIRACASGLQAARLQGYHAIGAPGVYRVLLLGPRGAGCTVQGAALARQFRLVYLNFQDLYNEALVRNDKIGENLRKFGTSVQLKAEIVRRRIMMKDCIDYGWVLCGYPRTGMDFEYLDNMPTPPNRVIFLNVSWETCKQRLLSMGVDWCTGLAATPGSGPRAMQHPNDTEANIDNELDYYFTEVLAELRAAAGITAVEIDGNQPIDSVQVKIQSAVIAAPAFDIECCSKLRNVRAD